MSTIGLWGRSMGAVTAIMYGDQDPSIAGMVLDSPFSSLKKLVEELVKEKVNLPNFVINQALKLVKSSVQKKANFKLDDIEPIKFAERCFIPALFVAANNDNFVKPHHAKILHDAYPGDKNLVNIEGDHNSHRPRFFKDSATIFFYNTLQVQYLKEISDNYAGYYKKKNDIFEDEKKNIPRKDILNESKQIIGNVLSDANLKNVDIECEDEENILNMILENSKKDFENLNINMKNENKKENELINSNGFGYVGSESESLNKNGDKDNQLFDFLNSQVKVNNKDNREEIMKEKKDSLNKEINKEISSELDKKDKKENQKDNFENKKISEDTKKIKNEDLDLINIDFPN